MQAQGKAGEAMDAEPKWEVGTMVKDEEEDKEFGTEGSREEIGAAHVPQCTKWRPPTPSQRP